MRTFKWFVIILGLFIIASCSLKPRGWWEESVIAVMADSTDWEALQGAMRSTFEHVIRTPQFEKTYSVKYITQADFARYSQFRYIVLAATLGSEGRIGKIVGNVVSDPEVRKDVEEGEQKKSRE